MSFSLPRPGDKYDQKTLEVAFETIEKIARTLWESTNSLASRGFTGQIQAVVTNAAADLTVTVEASAKDYPITAEVFEHDPTGVALQTFSVTADGVKTKVDYPALGNRPLPQRELERWWLRLTNAAGLQQWFGPTAADRDALPYGAVSVKDGVITIEYDDDVRSIIITVPSGKTKTWSGLTGGGTKTYTVATDALDDASHEAALALDETRATYVVDVTGGGDTRTMFRGSLKGPKAANVVAKLPATVTDAVADLTLIITATPFAYPVTWAVYEDDPTTTAIATGTAVADTTYTKAGVAALGNRALPLRELRRWWVKTTDATGAERLWGPTSADRDAVPNAAVTAVGSVIKVDYDDDTDTVKITVPGGKTKTFAGLSGSGTSTYTVGDALDDTTTEAPLGLDEQRGTYKVEVQGPSTGIWITVFNGKLLGPKGDNVTAKLSAAVTNGTADLTLILGGSSTAYSVTWAVYQDSPTSTAIASGTASSAGSIDHTTVGAFGSIALPLKEMRKWWVKTTDVHGLEKWHGPTSADRDAIPGGAVTSGGGALKCDYDDDTESIVVTIPGGRTRTWSGLSGGGTHTYTVTDALDDSSTEAALTASEERGTYVVTYTGGGKTMTLFRGTILGSGLDSEIDVTVSTADDKYTFTYSVPGGSSAQLRTDTGSWAAAPSSPFDVTRNARGGADKAIQLRAIRSSDSYAGAPKTFTVPAQTKISCSVTSFHANKDSSTQMSISWSESGIPSGCLRYVSYSIDGAEQGNSASDGSVTSPYTVTSVTLGSAPKGTLNLSIEKDGVVIASRTQRGLFTT